LTAFVPAEVQF